MSAAVATTMTTTASAAMAAMTAMTAAGAGASTTVAASTVTGDSAMTTIMATAAAETMAGAMVVAAVRIPAAVAIDIDGSGIVWKHGHYRGVIAVVISRGHHRSGIDRGGVHHFCIDIRRGIQDFIAAIRADAPIVAATEIAVPAMITGAAATARQVAAIAAMIAATVATAGSKAMTAVGSTAGAGGVASSMRTATGSVARRMTATAAAFGAQGGGCEGEAKAAEGECTDSGEQGGLHNDDFMSPP